MAVRVCVARTATQLDDLFRVRHEVFVGGGYMAAHEDGRIIDRFDAFPGAVNVIATVAGQVVGGIRLDLPSPCGVGADAYFDFDDHLVDPDRTGGISELCLLPEYRRTTGVNRTMWKMAAYVAASRGLTHLRASANPERRHVFEGLGFRALTEPFYDARSGLDVLPVLLRLDDTCDDLRNYPARQRLFGFEEVFDRMFFDPGETIVDFGDSNDECFLMLEGEATATPKSAPSVRLGAGEMLGELGLLTGEPSSSVVEAATAVEVMVLNGDQLVRQMRANPDLAINLLAQLAAKVVRVEGPARSQRWAMEPSLAFGARGTTDAPPTASCAAQVRRMESWPASNRRAALGYKQQRGKATRAALRLFSSARF